MNRAILLPRLLLVVQFVAPMVNALTCSNTPPYTSVLNPVCGSNDLFVKLPDYEDISSYYECLGATTPVLTSCAAGLVFTYVQQKCTTCEDYIPAPPCENLKSQSSSNCVSSSGSTPGVTRTPATSATPGTTPTTPTGLPTPYYPGSTDTTPTASNTTSGGGITRPTPSTDDTTADTTPGGGITRPTPSPSIPTPQTPSTPSGSNIPTPTIDYGTTANPNFPTVPAAPPTPQIVTAPPAQN